MVIIRNEQLEKIRLWRIKKFKEKLGDFLAGIFKEKFPYDIYKKQIDSFISLANESGFTTEKSVALLAELVFLRTGAFDIETLDPEIQNIIYQYKVDPECKLHQLSQVYSSKTEESTNHGEY